MSADFSTSAKRTMKHEGGFTVDTGGATNYGVSNKAHPQLTVAQIKALTPTTALPYYKKYWTGIAAGSISSQAAADVYFDTSFNAGQSRAMKLAVAALKGLGEPAKALSSPSLIVAAINRQPGFPNAFTAQRVAFYKGLAAKNPSKYGKYLAGWLKRANSFFSSSAAVKPGLAALILAAVAFAAYYRHTHKTRR